MSKAAAGAEVDIHAVSVGAAALDRRGAGGAQRDPESELLVAQLQALLEENTRLRDEWQRQTAEAEAEPNEAELEQRLQQVEARNKQLEVDLQAIKQAACSKVADPAAAMALAAKDAEIAGLQRNLLELELQAQEELGEMHEELLDVRRACQGLELALNESEQKRDKMQQDKQQMEQQLQESTGELAEIERQRRQQLSAKLAKAAGLSPVVSEEPDLGPATPPTLHPTRAQDEGSPLAAQPQQQQDIDAQALSREFDSIMQELVTRKMQLAELSEDYERVCHAFLKANEAANAPILARLKRRSSSLQGHLLAQR